MYGFISSTFRGQNRGPVAQGGGQLARGLRWSHLHMTMRSVILSQPCRESTQVRILFGPPCSGPPYFFMFFFSFFFWPFRLLEASLKKSEPLDPSFLPSFPLLYLYRGGHCSVITRTIYEQASVTKVPLHHPSRPLDIALSFFVTSSPAPAYSACSSPYLPRLRRASLRHAHQHSTERRYSIDSLASWHGECDPGG